MAPRRPQESKQPLIISLVFAVLMVLGLGVTAYYGFSGQDALRKDLGEQKKKADFMTGERDWYKFQAQYFRACIGQTEGIDFASLGTTKGQFDNNQLGGSATDKEAVTKIIKDMDNRLPWDTAQNRPRQSYEALLQQERERANSLKEQSDRFLAAKSDAERAAKKASDDLKNARASFDEKLEAMRKQTETDMSGYLAKIAEQRSEIDRQNQENEKVVKKETAEKKKSDEEISKAGLKIKDLQVAMDIKNEQLDVLQRKGVDVAPKGWQTDWKIVSIDRTGQQPFINIGSADNVQPQLTFSVHARGPAGQAVPQSKGSLEVVSVLGPHLSQARVLSVKDRAKEPLLKGDVLFNPVWSPTLQKHVALVGIMDVNGDGLNAVYDLIRTLERQNVVVDAYVDPRDNTIKGKGLTAQTAYLIEGKSTATEQLAGDDRGQKDATNKWLEENGKLKKLAKENGVLVVGLQNYLEQVGYRVQRSASSVGIATPSVLPAEQPAAAPKKDDKPKEDKPADEKPADEKPADAKPK
jgi:hypothetical protein